MNFESNEQLQERCNYWQERLKLRDWTVRAELTRVFDFQEEGKAGEILIKAEHRFALIYILPEGDYSDRKVFPIDQERVLVHELLHIHLEPLWPEERRTSCHIPEEQAINAIADALIALERNAEQS